MLHDDAVDRGARTGADHGQIVQQIRDEMEYRVRTAAALAKGGHSINAEVEAGKVRAVYLAEELAFAAAGAGAEVDRETLIDLWRSTRPHADWETRAVEFGRAVLAARGDVS